MSRFRAYIKPFEADGTYADDYIEITEDVSFSGIGTLSQKIDNSSYNVGIFNFTDINLTLRNEHGKYEDITGPNTIFKYKRTDSIFKLVWQVSDDLTQCGNAICGEALANIETTVYLGLLNDESLVSDIQRQDVKFKVLGLESIFRRTDLESITISVSDTFSDTITSILNQSEITDLITIGSISVGVDQGIDVPAAFTGKTVKEALDILLKLSNSILYVENSTLYVTPRTEGVSLAYTFYGQASDEGIESIMGLSAVKSGLDRTFNYWTWGDTALTPVLDATSRALNGTRKNSVSSDAITNTTSQTAILTDLKDEFKDPKREFDLTTPLSYETLELFILDKVQVDYPTPYSVPEGGLIPIYGSSVYGVDRYPIGEYGITISSADRFKIMGRKISITNQTITFSLREI